MLCWTIGDSPPPTPPTVDAGLYADAGEGVLLGWAEAEWLAEELWVEESGGMDFWAEAF